jgi:plasmid maintenance system killer protein
MCAYQIGEHLHLTFADHLDFYSQQANPNFRLCTVNKQIPIEQNQIRFLMKGEKTFLKENIPAFSVQRKSRSISVLQKNLVTIIQSISESYDHLDFYSQQANPNFRLCTVNKQIPIFGFRQSRSHIFLNE